MKASTGEPIFEAAVRESGIDPRKIAAREKWNLASAKQQLRKGSERRDLRKVR